MIFMIKFLHGVRVAFALAASGLLLFTAYVKAFDQQAFGGTLAAQGVIPERYLAAATVSIPAGEFLIAGASFILILRRPASVAACVILAATFVAFAGYALTLHFFPPPKPAGCGCGFSDGPVSNWFGVAARNGAVASVLGSLALLKLPAGVPDGAPLPTHAI